MSMNKKVIGSIILGIILIISGAVFYTNFSRPSPSLKFYTEGCGGLKIDPYSPPREGILNKSWKDEDTLVIEGYVKTFCGGATIIGDYVLEGDNLILKYDIEVEGPVTMCNCVHKVIYEISNLEKKDYSISIISE